ncbi:DUF7426 family protein [Agromyces ramosus]|uniref:DUF7426 domain-containing protein n=1 Tax=Agromyces ramosus TaxID=33879 RepID=A0ABU0R8M4_9MICO|nr:hypothetical protein [Agromyces ramosus]MDQ0894424.1 hypothetical protein [Agromyces ramosus]
MTQLREYNEFADGPLEFPIGGKVYTAPEVSIPLGLRLNNIATGEAEQDLPAVELYKLLLGPVWDEMIADGVPLNAAMRAGMVAMNDFQYGREYAVATWEAGLNPKAAAELMASQHGNRASRRSKSTAAARKTP